MNDEKTMIQLQAATVAVLHRIATALEAIALSKAPAPNFVRPISEYAEFDFNAIGAKVAAHDRHGPTSGAATNGRAARRPTSSDRPSGSRAPSARMKRACATRA